MMRKLMMYAAMTGVLLAATPTIAAAPCKDAKGRFVKCPPRAPAKPVRCKDARGKFARCGTPGARPV